MPTIDHPLARLAEDRALVSDLVSAKLMGRAPSDTKILEDELADSLFFEKKRLEGFNDPVRDAVDDAFWKMMAREIPSALGDVDGQKILLEKVARFHLDEVAGHFDERVYKLATTVVPRGFASLLQAVSLKNFAKMLNLKTDLRDKVVIGGKLDQLRTLSKKGTVLLTPTHFSNLDSILMGWALYDLGLPPFAYGAGLNLFSNPALAYFMNNLGAYKVDRKKKHHFYREILKEYSTTIIERGCHSLFFPGGGRSRSGGLENKIKRGLLGTGLTAYIRNLTAGKENPNIYIVPCVISYHFVLEASSLISEFLKEQGRSRYIPVDEDSLSLRSLLQFLYNFFSASSKIHMNFGQAMDPFGHLVDDEGNSLNDHGSRIDPVDFVRSDGEIKPLKQRDDEYTEILADRIVDRYAKENIVLSSHFLAYTYFCFLKKKYPEKDLYRLLRLSERETTIPFNELAHFATHTLHELQILEKHSKLKLHHRLKQGVAVVALEAGYKNLGLYHTKRPVRIDRQGEITTICSEDMSLLYYYHNRMANYDLTHL